MTDRFYEFRVDGRLPVQARDAFCDMDVDADPDVGQTRPGAVLRGTVVDDAHLHGILEQLHLLGLRVVAAHPVPARPEG
ncbi:hypothetical protein Acsp06_37430 [Actinomycetospora sp. NBRC 106375]|uniref:hypothetical protein n=1 Tax=Actinomycetospora sp. NBRC 106375 TaxID=3032207 RepID=UPI0024A3C8C2|nr:hypothetical protein [Actinomycetospora sp. NBRC 106375]GLZ47558.1 hypothetical protein Acsp06_37430 [Actinomycetospora sp. NBRC 106375]